LNHTECLDLADQLGESPETVISVHLLRRTLCRGYAAHGHAIIQSTQDPAEPTAFGLDPLILWELLEMVDGWTCLNLPAQCAQPLGEIMVKETGRAVRYYSDVYHLMTGPVHPYRHEAVRLLTADDTPLVESASPELQGAGFHSREQMLAEGVVAGGIIDGTLVAIAHTSARSEKFADIGVATLAPWRNQGLSTAATSLVAQRVQHEGQIPVWSCGEDNYGSLRVAGKVGYKELLRRSYVIPMED